MLSDVKPRKYVIFLRSLPLTCVTTSNRKRVKTRLSKTTSDKFSRHILNPLFTFSNHFEQSQNMKTTFRWIMIWRYNYQWRHACQVSDTVFIKNQSGSYEVLTKSSHEIKMILFFLTKREFSLIVYWRNRRFCICFLSKRIETA